MAPSHKADKQKNRLQKAERSHFPLLAPCPEPQPKPRQVFLKEFDIYGLRGVAQPLQQWEPVLILAEQAVSRGKCWPLAASLAPLSAPL